MAAAAAVTGKITSYELNVSGNGKLSGTVEIGCSVGFGNSINEITGTPELSSLAVWYLAAHTVAPRFTVTDVADGRFSRALASVGMTWSGSEQMTGDTRRVARYAAA